MDQANRINIEDATRAAEEVNQTGEYLHVAPRWLELFVAAYNRNKPDVTIEEYAEYVHGAKSAGLKPYSYTMYCGIINEKNKADM